MMVNEPLNFDFDEVDVFLTSSHSKQKNRSVWSSYILSGGQTEIRGGVIGGVTVYAALLVGCIEIINQLPVHESATVHCTNTGFLRGVNERLQGWIDNDWKRTDPNTGELTPISNYVRHWEEIARLKTQRTVKFRKADQLVSEIYIDRAKKLGRWLLSNSL